MSSMLKRGVFSWFAFWVVLAGVGLYSLLPLRKAIRFGIDLVGGTYITLEVQTDKAVEAELLSQMQAMPDKLQEANIESPTNSVLEKNEIVLTFPSVQAAQNAASVLVGAKPTADQMRQGAIASQIGLVVAKSEGNVLRLRLTDAAIKYISRDAVERNIEVLHNRLNPLSVSEITVAAQREKNIIVELPDVEDPQQAKNMIGKSALLELKLVEKVAQSEDDILYELDGELESDQEILPSKEVGRDGKPLLYFLVSKYANITGKDLKNAKPTLDNQIMQPVVSFEFTSDGGDRFYELTSQNIGKNLAIILDGVVISAPTINGPLRTSGQIQGGFTSDSARELSLLLRSGAFVAPVTFEEERQIGPALGAESIRKGLISCLIGLSLLFIFSLFYYKVAGFFAFLALIYNLFLVLIGLSLLGSTLTLPGIAGMVLTIGMAIDASILIYERIKEELVAGVPFREALNKGFAGAMTVILDANITTFIVGIVLYKFGAGPIKGFAVTMMLGIVSTLITGLFFLRSLFNFVLDNFNVQKIKI